MVLACKVGYFDALTVAVKISLQVFLSSVEHEASDNFAGCKCIFT